MVRKIIHIDQEKCNGCGACASACHEGAIAMVDGKAQLIGTTTATAWGTACPPAPPGPSPLPSGRLPPTTRPRCSPSGPEKGGGPSPLRLPRQPVPGHPPGGEPRPGRGRRFLPAAPVAGTDQAGAGERPLFRRGPPAHRRGLHGLRLRQFPPGLHPGQGGAHRLPQAGRGGLHGKAHQIIRQNDIKSLTIVRMEVPCCGGIQRAATTSLQNSGKFIPWQVVTIATDGRILE